MHRLSGPRLGADDAAGLAGLMLEHAPSILFFDGACGLCTRSVQWILARDHRRKSVRFAPLGGRTAARALTLAPELARVDSVVWIAYPGARALVRSEAVRAVLSYLGGPWRWLGAAMAIVPTPLADLVYDAVARRRHHLTRRLGECRLPTPEESARFLS